MKERIRICNPQDCVTLLRRYSRMKQEHFGAIFLNAQREVIQTKCFFVGSDNVCTTYPKIVFWKACKLEASAMILFHNHPSGNTSPSNEDIKLTEKFEKGGAYRDERPTSGGLNLNENGKGKIERRMPIYN